MALRFCRSFLWTNSGNCSWIYYIGKRSMNLFGLHFTRILTVEFIERLMWNVKVSNLGNLSIRELQSRAFNHSANIPLLLFISSPKGEIRTLMRPVTVSTPYKSERILLDYHSIKMSRTFILLVNSQFHCHYDMMLYFYLSNSSF